MGRDSVSYRRLRLIVAAAVLVALAGAGNALGAGGVVISQVYGGGGNSGATLKHDFVELYNRTAAPVDVTGWSVQYASSTGTTWQRTSLTGTIAPGGHYLIQQAQGAGGTAALPTPDATGTIAMSATAGKVVLNDFEFSETIDILEGGILTTLMDILPREERYSYVFEGNSQVLDQILVSNSVLDRFPVEYDVVHVNSEFADQASDHEPQVARIDLTGRP